MHNKKLQGKKILVTGGAGFIGSNLIERLLNEGGQVTCLDNLSTGFLRNIEGYMSHPMFSFVNGDIRDRQLCDDVCIGKDIVFHQAALGSVPRSVKSPLPTHDVNCTGFINMLQSATKAGVRRFVYASSSSVYGDHPTLPKVEENIGKHLSPYAITKYSNELNAAVFGKLYGIETIGLRYFNVFGKNQSPEGAYAAVIPKFIKAILGGELIEIHGDGMQSRDFTYIDNVLDVNILAATTTNQKAYDTVFNVAYGHHMQLIELLEMIEEKIVATRSNIRVVRTKHVPTRKGDIKHSFADVSKAINLLNYRPSVDVSEGLEKAIDLYCKAFAPSDAITSAVMPVDGIDIEGLI